MTATVLVQKKQNKRNVGTVAPLPLFAGHVFQDPKAKCMLFS